MKCLLIILLLSCTPVKKIPVVAPYMITQIRLAPGGHYMVWFQNRSNVFYRVYKLLPDSFQVGRVVRIRTQKHGY